MDIYHRHIISVPPIGVPIGVPISVPIYVPVCVPISVPIGLLVGVPIDVPISILIGVPIGILSSSTRLIRENPSLDIFKKQLRTFLFKSTLES